MKDIKQLRQEILTNVAQYYTKFHQKNSHFMPGSSRIPYASRVFDEREIVALVDSALEFWLTSGRYTQAFEKHLAKYLGVRFALLVNSGSSANLLAFFALTSPLLKKRQIQRGDEVISLAAGFPTTITPILQYGAVPVFVDIDDTLNLNTADLNKALSPKTKAIMIAHTLGNPFDITTIKAFCNQHNLWLIEDNCDALGSEYQGKKTGAFGDIATSSFYPPHHITTGEGGAVYTNNPMLKKILLSMRDWGRDCWCASGVDNTCKARFSKQYGNLPFGYDHKYVYSHFGFNLKATDMQAAIGCKQLEKLPHFVTQRRTNYQKLYNALKGVQYLHLVEAQRDSSPSWFGFMIIIDENAPFTRNDITGFLESKHIQTRTLFAGNILKHPAFTHLQEGKDYRIASDLKRTNAVMERGFWVGVYPGLQEVEIDYIITTIRGFVKEKH